MPLVLPGQESANNEPWRRFERHHHVAPYAALVIRGACDEAGDRGRFRAAVGDVLVHDSFDGHGDTIGSSGATFINFVLVEPLPGSFGRVADVDAIIRAHERDPREGAAELDLQFRPAVNGHGDWPDLLAADLATRRRLAIEAWADAHCLHRGSVSRGFRLAYGVSPKRFRLEQFASRAARTIRRGGQSLASIAADCGFADQAHMTRSLVALFGTTPGSLRRPG